MTMNDGTSLLFADVEFSFPQSMVLSFISFLSLTPLTVGREHVC